MQRKCGQLYEHDRKPGSCIYHCRTVQYTLKLYTLTIPRHIYKKIIKKNLHERSIFDMETSLNQRVIICITRTFS